MNRLFGTDGVRGIANKELTPELSFNLGKAGASVLAKNKGNKPVFIIGRDTRISGDLLEHALVAGILAVGGDVIKVGVVPTPAVAFLIKKYNADAGAVISASHNPFEYNGIKFFNKNGFKLDDNIEDEIEDIIVRNIDENKHFTGTSIGKCIDIEKGQEDYEDYLKSLAKIDLSNKKFIIDCSNGAAYNIAPSLYKKLGAEVVVIGNEPNGENINKGCGSTHIETLCNVVLKEKADAGLAFDGDADRFIAVDEKGQVIDGDKVICICAKMLKDHNRLKNNIVTTTVMSNMGFHKYMKEIGCEVRVTSVGDRYVLEDMLKTGSLIGGEQSGHIIFLENSTTGDGILSSIEFVKALLHSNKKASELSSEIEIFPQVLKNAKVQNINKARYMEDKDIKLEIEKLEKELKDEGRILIRPSGTEELVRVMIEGKDKEKITKMAEHLALLITKKLG